MCARAMAFSLRVCVLLVVLVWAQEDAARHEESKVRRTLLGRRSGRRLSWGGSLVGKLGGKWVGKHVDDIPVTHVRPGPSGIPGIGSRVPAGVSKDVLMRVPGGILVKDLAPYLDDIPIKGARESIDDLIAVPVPGGVLSVPVRTPALRLALRPKLPTPASHSKGVPGLREDLEEDFFGWSTVPIWHITARLRRWNSVESSNETSDDTSDSFCSAEGACLTHQAYGGGSCVAGLPAFPVVHVTAFDAVNGSHLIVNGNRYSGKSLENTTFVLWSQIVWDGYGHFQICMEAPPLCPDGFELTPVSVEECPAGAELLSKCEEAEPGELCEGDGQCGTRTDINNCYDSGYRYPASRDVYRKQNFTRNESNVAIAALFTTTTTTRSFTTEFSLEEEQVDGPWHFQGPCEVHGRCLSSPGYPDRYGENETCVASLPPFTALTVKEFGTEKFYDQLTVNGVRYSGGYSGRGLRGESFVLWSNITWTSDESNEWWYKSHYYWPNWGKWKLCLDAPPMCSDGLLLTPVPVEDCPAGAEVLSNCEEAVPGELCEGNGQCGTRSDINNCYDSNYTYPASRDVYRKRNGTAVSWIVDGPCRVIDGCVQNTPAIHSPGQSCNMSLTESGTVTFKSSAYWGSLWINGRKYGDDDSIHAIFVESTIRWNPSGGINGDRWVICIGTRDQVQLPEFPARRGGLSAVEVLWICLGAIFFFCCSEVCRRLCKDEKDQEESEAFPSLPPQARRQLEDGVLPVPPSRRQRERSQPPELSMESPLDLGAAWLICHADAEPVVWNDVRGHPMFRLEVDCVPPRQVWSDGSIYELESSTKDMLRWTGHGKEHSWVRVPSCPQNHCHMMKLSQQCQFTCAHCQKQCTSGCFWRCCVCKDRCLCPSCAAVPKSKQLLGISAAYVLETFPALARQRIGLENPNFYEMAPVVAMGETGLGYGKTCSEDGEPNCSIVDAVEEHHKGKASHFVSWCWACRLNDFVGALRAWMERDSVSTSEAYLWICFFCDNQYRLPKSGTLFSSAKELQTVLESRLAKAGQMLFLVDAETTCAKRAWCLFEAFTCVDKQLPITIMLPDTHEGLQEAFSTIDLRTARATSKADEDMINEVVLTSTGFDAANERVRDCLLECLKH